MLEVNRNGSLIDKYTCSYREKLQRNTSGKEILMSECSMQLGVWPLHIEESKKDES